MDSLTQAVLGASLQGALLGRFQGRKALLYGAALATLPDLDVVIDYGDAVADMTYHRGFSHSLSVLSLLAVLLTWLIRRAAPNPAYTSLRLFVTLWLVLITHPLLDAFTSYGTQLWWPLTPTPTAWASIFIIDPLYTLPLLAAVLIALVSGLKNGSRAPAIALGVSSLYLASTLISQAVMQQRVETQLSAQGISAHKVFVTPTPFNSLLWRAIALDGDDYYESLTGWFDTEPPQLLRLPRGAVVAQVLDGNPAHQRLRWFTDDYLRYDHVGDHLVVTDLRLGMTGYHPFRFDFAQWQDGAWRVPASIERLAFDRGDPAQLKRLLTRIWRTDQPVPLAHWAARLAQTPPN